MRIDKLTQEILNDIFNIYKETVDCRWGRNLHIERIKEDLSCGNCSEWRYGSKFSGQSKFQIYRMGGELRFIFYPNYTPLNKREEKQIKKTELEFEEKVVDYLRKKELF